jgi:cytidylate kinase
MYRALAWSVLQKGLEAEDDAALRAHLAAVEVEVRGERVMVDGRDVTEEIRTREVAEFTSRLSRLAVVRDKVVPIQRRLAAAGGVILEGRDTGTVVCPDAEVKFYLDATLETRARRRWAEFRAQGLPVELATVRAELEARDRQDRTRDLAPLRPAPDAVVIDTTGLSVDEVVVRLLTEIERRCSIRC